MDKIIEALTKLLPEDQVSEVSEAVTDMIDESKEELNKEYNDKLEEAYAQLSKELKDAESVAVQGYEEAYGIINDLRNRLEMQREEYEAALKEGYQEAYDMLVDERGKNENLEVGVYEEYEEKLGEMKGYIVDKVDQFLHYKGQEIYENAKRDVLSDPRMAEHKVVLDKIVDLTSGYLSEEEAVLATSAKLDNANKIVEELKGHKKILESKVVRLDRERKELTEAVAVGSKLLAEANDNQESVVLEQKERIQKAKDIEGKGSGHNGPVEVIAEHNEATSDNADQNEDTIVESVGGIDLDQLAVLSGLKKEN